MGSRSISRRLVLVALSVGGLYFSGRGHFVDPPWTHPAALTGWWEREGSIVGVFSAMRVALIGAGVYWFALLVAVGASRHLGGKRMLAVLCRSRILGAKNAVSLVVGASAMGSVLVVAPSSSLASPVPASDPAPVLTNLAGVSPAVSSPPILGGVAPVLDPAKPPRTTTSPAGATVSVEPAVAAPRVPPTVSNGRVQHVSNLNGAPFGPTGAGDTTAGASGPKWVVRPGDDLWSIAERTLEANWHQAPTDPQVARYWQLVIESNRARLPVPADPSLLFPADVIVLPPVPAWQ